MQSSLNWNDLKYFGQVAAQLSVRQAASAMNMSAATLSRRIMNLEEYLGETLFVRKGNRLELTTFGQYVYEQVLEARTSIQDVEERCAAGSEQHRIRISAPSTYTQFVLMALVRDLSSRFEHVTFELNSQRTASDHSDIVVSHTPPDSDQFSHNKLLPAKYRLYRQVGSEHSNGIIRWPNDSVEHQIINKHLQEFMPKARVVAVADCIDSYTEAVAHGLGVGILCSCALSLHPKRDQLEPLTQAFSQELWLSCSRNGRPAVIIRQIERKIRDADQMFHKNQTE